MSEDRDQQGRFVAGHANVSPGRPKRSSEIAYLAAVTEACPLETWTQVCRALVERALGGDVAAATFLANRLLGKPVEQPLPLGQAVRIADAADAAIAEITAQRRPRPVRESA